MSTFAAVSQFILHVGVGLVLAILFLLYPFLYFFQERLLFFPRPLSVNAVKMLQQQAPHAAMSLQTTDGISLHGWLVNVPETGRVPLLIYWGGNAEEVSDFISMDAWQFPGWAVLSVNYRGYGESGGKPGEHALFEDARLIFDWAKQQPGIDPERIVVMGRSLGTGVAVHVAAVRQVAGVCLVSPYDSIRSVAQRIYPWVPVRWLLRHPFDSLAQAPQIRAPLLMVLASEDTVIPLQHSRRLFAAWGGVHQEKLFLGQDHNTISLAGGYYETIREFLHRLPVRE